MIVSMTGYGKASKSYKDSVINAEIKTVNSKFMEAAIKLPLTVSTRENDIREIVKDFINRGKVNISISIDRATGINQLLQIDIDSLDNYLKLLEQVKNRLKIKDDIRIDHIIQFSEIFKKEDSEETDKYWPGIVQTLKLALNDLSKMRKKEGIVLEKDIKYRLGKIDKSINRIEKLFKKNVDDTKKKLRDKVKALVTDLDKIDPVRLDLEIVLLADKLDITEEIVRTRSHLNYFYDCIVSSEPAGRRLNFLVQEINREINTIASKSNHSLISQHVVEMKEELEKIKEQLQNVE